MMVLVGLGNAGPRAAMFDAVSGSGPACDDVLYADDAPGWINDDVLASLRRGVEWFSHNVASIWVDWVS